MRALVSAVLFALGGSMLLAGAAVAVVAGPDDTAMLPADDVRATSGVAITAFDMLPVRDLTLHVTATSTTGPVFLGTAHPVDARDYVNGVNASWVRGLDRTGALTAQALEGGLEAPDTDPTAATFWTASASGEGAQSLDVRLTGDPVTFVVAPLGGPATTTLAFGALVPRVFVTALGTAAVGALLVVLAVLVRRRTGRGTIEPSRVDAPEIPDTEPSQREPVPAAAARDTTERRAAVLAAGLTVVLTACAPLPSAVEYPDEPTRPAVTGDELTEALTSYTERTNAASALAAQLDASGWATSDSDGLLLVDEYDTRLAAARGEAPAATTVTYSILDAAVPEFTSYPMWFVAVVQPTTDGTPDEQPELRVLERDRATAPWRASFAIDVPADAVDLPEPGAASTATPEQVATGLAALELVRSHLETGAEAGVELGDLQTFRETVIGNDLGGLMSVVTSEVRHLGEPEDPTAANGPVQVVPVDGGVLVTSAMTYLFNRRVEPGYTVYLDDPAVAAVTGQTGDRENVRTLGLVGTVLLVPDGAAPRVVSAGWSLIAPAG